jgi:tight adherence protein C
MSVMEIMVGLMIAYVIYELLGHFLPSKENGDTPWTASGSVINEPKQSRSLAGMGKKFNVGQWFLKNEKYRAGLELILIRSGYPFRWSVEDFFFFKLVLTGFALILLWLCGANHWLYWLGGLYVGFQFLDFYLKGKAKTRQNEISRSLPGFIDLLTLTIEGGLDLMAAVERILEKIKPGALREELQTISQETRLGTPRKEALEHWAFRTNIPDVLSLTSMIIQSEELGTGLSTVLRSYSDDMRVRRITRAEEAAGKAPVKLLFPMMVFFFPIVFVVIFGPLAMSVMSSYKK